MTDIWLRSIRQQLQSWFTKAQVMTEGSPELPEPPPALLAQIEQQLDKLPTPRPYQDDIQEVVRNHLRAWQQDVDAPNSLVMLDSPVESLATSLRTSFQNWDEIADLQVLDPFETQRPPDPLMIDAQVQHCLESCDPIQTQVEQPLSATEADLEHRNTIILVPNLEQCFLRCIGGWDGIETLRAVITQNRQCFWVVGCNRWAWDFLDFVCQISADFSEVQTLTRLDGIMLRDWLSPLVTVLVAEENQNAPPHQQTDDRATKEEKTPGYWDNLADLSLGVSTIAAQLWLQSLRIETEALPAEEEPMPSLDFEVESPQDNPVQLQVIKPFLPSSPALSSGDRYLLHSVLIHGRITSAHLALSLGDSENRIRSQVQPLLRAGVLQQYADGLSVRPSYYTKLKNQLVNDNFFVGQD